MTNSRLRLVCAIIALFAALPIFAQQASNSSGTPVTMIVTVEPHHGAQVPVVNREDVMVNEGKERDQVTSWVPAHDQQAHLDLFLFIDDASSFALSTQIGDLKKFVSSQEPTVKVGVAYMQNGAASIVQDPTTDHQLAAKALRLPEGVGGAEASPYFSLTDLIKRWPADGSRHEVLMVTSGIDLYYSPPDLSNPYLASAIDAAQRAGVVVSAIYAPAAGHYGHSYWPNYWGQLYLSQLTEETGGESYYVLFNGPAVDFSPYLKDVTNRLARQYLLTFLPKPQTKPGWHSIKLRTELHDVDLVGAHRVYVPGSE